MSHFSKTGKFNPFDYDFTNYWYATRLPTNLAVEMCDYFKQNIAKVQDFLKNISFYSDYFHDMDNVILYMHMFSGNCASLLLAFYLVHTTTAEKVVFFKIDQDFDKMLIPIISKLGSINKNLIISFI